MRILVIGGRSFVGRHFVEAAVNHGHQVTLLNRGKKYPELFAELDSIEPIGSPTGYGEALSPGADRLLEAGLDLWNDLPLSTPLDGSQDGLLDMQIGKALENGFELRPLCESIRDINEWLAAKPEEQMKVGLSDRRQAELVIRYG